MARVIAQADIDSAKADRPDRKYVVLTPDDGDGDEFLFAVPKIGEYTKFRAMVLEEETRASALRILVDSCAVAPSAAEFAIITQDHPGYIESFGNQILHLAGAGVSVRVKKV